MQKIGRYQVLGELGRGAMGIVYRALDPTIGRTVAIKTIRLNDFLDASERLRLRDRLMREAQSAGILSHPNIVTIYDVSEENDLAYIAMEFVDGVTLERLLHTNPPDQNLVLSIIQQTATALDYAHKRGIVHRDIKPANVMIHEGAVAKIADFGVAKIQSNQMTQSGTIMGTPNYMPPEQIQGLPVEGTADQFSLAVIAYELLTGEKPFRADTMPALIFKIVKEEPAAPSKINPSLGWPVDVVLKRALSKDPADRYSSCSDFAHAFTNACKSSKGWHPLQPGGRHDLPTMQVMTAAAPSKDDDRLKTIQIPAVTTAPAEPKPLRILRTLAVVVVAAGLVSAAMIGAFHYFNNSFIGNQEPQVDPEPPVIAAKKPSPTQAPAVEEVKPVETQTPAITEPAPAELAANLISYPPGGAIVIDSNPELTCTTPCSIRLAPGRHTLEATLAGYRTALRIFELPKEAELFVKLQATTGTVMVRSDPAGGSISVDGKPRSEKTPSLLTLPTGPHKLEVAREGFRNYSEEIEVKDSVITNIDVSWGTKAQ